MIEHVSFTCEPLGRCHVARVAGVEAMNALPRWTVDLLVSDPEIDFDVLVQQPAMLALADGGEAPAREIPLVITHASYAGPIGADHRYAVELSAGVWPLALRRGYRIFQQQTAQEVIDELLRGAGLGGGEVEWRLSGRYARRVQCAQYGESEWAFIERLLAEEGISYWFDLAAGRPILAFGDTTAAHDGIPGEIHVPFVDASGMSGTASSFFALSRADEMCQDAVHVRDYDIRQPNLLVEGRAGSGVLEHFEYPAGVVHAEAAQARAAVRLEQLQRFATSAWGWSGCTRLQPGRVVKIVGASDDAFNGAWLIVEVMHAIEQRAWGPSAQPYRNEVRMVPWAPDAQARYFRPALPAAHPQIEGIETAIVTGPMGEEIHVDDLGRVTVALPWDPSGRRDEKSSQWARTLQMNMGGSMLLPRVGWEVAVGYVDGRPEDPIVLGQVYNAAKAPPYPLPAMKGTSALRSNTSPHDGSSNEIRFGDSAGGQEVFVHASNTQAVTVGGSASTSVGANATHDVKRAHGIHVKGAQTVHVGGAQRVDVGSAAQTLVKGARTETVGGVDDIGVTANRRVAAGSYTEAVGALYGLQCNEAVTSVKGPFIEATGGNLAAMAGLGTHESVAAARVELVGGARNVVAGRGFADETWGAKLVVAGAAKDTAAGNIETTAASASTAVAGSATISAGGKVQFEAATIAVTVGGSLAMKGGSTAKLSGKLKVSGGTTKFDAATTRRKATTKAGA